MSCNAGNRKMHVFKDRPKTLECACMTKYNSPQELLSASERTETSESVTLLHVTRPAKLGR